MPEAAGELAMAATVRVGVLNDIGDIGADPDGIADGIEREVDLLRRSGRIAAPVEFVHAYGLGLPTGTAEAIEQAFEQLLAQDVALIVGPGIGDNALVAASLADRHRVPTINWAGAERARSKHMFQLQSGSSHEEAATIAQHLARCGVHRPGIVHDMSSAGTRYRKCLESEAAILGLEVVASHGVSSGDDDAREAVAAVLASEPDAIVYLGLGGAAPALSEALATRNWDGERIMTVASAPRDLGSTCEGWAHIAMHSDGNATLRGLCESRGIQRQDIAAAARGHDLGRLVAEGIARAHDHSREGVRAALEQVKWLPAAQGEDGTLLGFGVQDRGALHGRYLVVRRWTDGASVEITRP